MWHTLTKISQGADRPVINGPISEYKYTRSFVLLNKLLNHFLVRSITFCTCILLHITPVTSQNIGSRNIGKVDDASH